MTSEECAETPVVPRLVKRSHAQVCLSAIGLFPGPSEGLGRSYAPRSAACKRVAASGAGMSSGPRRGLCSFLACSPGDRRAVKQLDRAQRIGGGSRGAAFWGRSGGAASGKGVAFGNDLVSARPQKDRFYHILLLSFFLVRCRAAPRVPKRTERPARSISRDLPRRTSPRSSTLMPEAE